MAHLSKRVLKPKIRDQINTALVHIVKTLDSSSDVDKFFNTILSPTEQLMIAKRVVASYLLIHNVPGNEICDLLKLTPETVCRLKLRMLLAGKDFDSIIKKLETLKRNKIIKDILFKILNYAIVVGSGRIPNPLKPKFRSSNKTPSIY